MNSRKQRRAPLRWQLLFLTLSPVFAACRTTEWDRTAMACMYPAAWRSTGTLLVAGPEWGIAELTAKGELVSVALGPEWRVTSLGADPRSGSEAVFFGSSKGRAPESNDCLSTELYYMESLSAEPVRITQDDRLDRVLCVNRKGEAVVGSSAIGVGGFLALWNEIGLSTLTRSGQVTASRELHDRLFQASTHDTGDLAVDSLDFRRTGHLTLLQDLTPAPSNTNWLDVRSLQSIAAFAADDADEYGRAGTLVVLRDDLAGQQRILHRTARHTTTYAERLAPGGGFASFIEHDHSMDTDHTLHIVDTTTGLGVSIALPLETDRRGKLAPIERVPHAAP